MSRLNIGKISIGSYLSTIAISVVYKITELISTLIKQICAYHDIMTSKRSESYEGIINEIDERTLNFKRVR